MTAPAAVPSSTRPFSTNGPLQSTHSVLRRLFLTLFLRGRSSRGLNRKKAPTSIGQKLWVTLGFYAAVGLLAIYFVRKPVFGLSVYLHAMTFVFLGMFIAASSGEILFNKEEADILLHRPVSARQLLWAKVRVMVEVSLWLSCAINLAGFFVGLTASDSGWSFPLVHLISTVLEALFCAGLVVMVYQLCLRWFGRERLEGLMTAAQVVVSVAAVLIGQILPQVIFRAGNVVKLGTTRWWTATLPPAWFAGFDDALAGSMRWISWAYAALAVLATALVLWMAFGTLAGDYETGLQLLGERPAPKTGHRGRRWLDKLVNLPPLCWWLRNPVSRASFLLTAAYLVRDRDLKLRIYPGLAPMLAIPLLLLWSDHGTGGFGAQFGIAFVGVYIALIPALALGLLQHSQQWQASDVFRVAPLAGPGAICDGARRAVICLLTLPLIAAIALLSGLMLGSISGLPLLLPGLIALPVFALIPNIGGSAVPLSLPTEEAKSTRNGPLIMLMMFCAFVLSGLAFWAWSTGWFVWLIMGEIILSVAISVPLKRSIRQARWTSLE